MPVPVTNNTEESQEVSAKTEEFRNYKDSERQARVQHHYEMMRKHQTYDYVIRMKEKFSKFNNREMSIVDALEAVGDFVDASDPDTDFPNIVHMFQTAESLRAAGEPDWMQLTGLVHDLGKLIYLFGNEKDGQDGKGGDQWGIGGDTFIVGCRIPDEIVFSEFNSSNPDMNDPKYNTDLGVYQPHCGLHNVHCSFGHDEYMYMVLKNHPQCTLPQAGLDIVRFHSMYVWHDKGGYQHLMNESDKEMLTFVKRFQKHDLYTKHAESPNIEALREYYVGLIEKYMPGKLKW
jgi:inositol oxygenase